MITKQQQKITVFFTPKKAVKSIHKTTQSRSTTREAHHSKKHNEIAKSDHLDLDQIMKPCCSRDAANTTRTPTGSIRFSFSKQKSIRYKFLSVKFVYVSFTIFPTKNGNERKKNPTTKTLKNGKIAQKLVQEPRVRTDTE